VSALRVPRTRLATSADKLATSAVIAPTQPLREELDVAVTLPRSATSAPRLVTSQETAQRLEVTRLVVALEVNKAAMAVAMAVDHLPSLATAAVDLVT